MDFEYSDRVKQLSSELWSFLNERVIPAEEVAAEQLAGIDDPHAPPPVLEDLKAEARSRGLWNLFLPNPEHGAGLTNLEYAPLAEIMGRSPLASEACNCSAPDTGNMEILAEFGTAEQKERWLQPLLDGEIRSAFAMTEPDVASSDARNIQTRIERDGDHYVINGRKWFISGANDPRCAFFIVMGKTNPDADPYHQQSMVIVPKDTPGVTIDRDMLVFGYLDRGGHPQITFNDVRVPVENLLGEEGGGFAIAQARLGPGRIHHCMRTIGAAERALELLCQRALHREAFGKRVADQSVIQEWIAESRIDIEQARLLVLKTAWLMDTVGNKGARVEIGAIKVAVPNMALRIIDRAIQVHGAAGVSQDFPLARMYASIRTLRIADGPDEVHKMTVARRELRRHDPSFRSH